MVLRLALFAALLGVAQAPEPIPNESLFRAIQRADSAEVDRLLQSGVSPNAVNAGGDPALMVATLFADVESMEVLLRYGADPRQANGVGSTPLMWAIPNLDKVRLLIDHGADVNARTSTLERTPFLIASSYPGSAEVLGLLVAHGADIRATDAGGADALRLAIRSADAEVVRFLVESGIDPNQGTVSLNRPHLPTVDYLMSAGLKVGENSLIGATNWQDPALIASWVEMGADVNARSANYGRTPLMVAAASELAGPATLKLLLDLGADPNAESTEGERPLDWAVYRDAQGKIEVLEQYGARRGDGPRARTFDAPDGIDDPRVSLRRSVSLLLASSPPMFDNVGCVTCHNNTLPGLAAATARRKDIDVDERLVRENLDDILAVYGPGADDMMQGRQAIGGIGLTIGYVAMALAAEEHPADRMTAVFTHWVAATQMPDGSWIGNGANRPPMEYSAISHTAMAVRVLTLYQLAARADEIEGRLERARDWLVASEAHSAEERGMRLMGLVWAGAERPAVDAAIAEIRGHQGANGGWSQLAQLENDAYATGLSLFALNESGVAVTDDTYRRGVAYLLRTQYADGSWLVRTRAFPVQGYFESGFPFGRHQWISAAGTGWAAVAIARSLPDRNNAP